MHAPIQNDYPIPLGGKNHRAKLFVSNDRTVGIEPSKMDRITIAVQIRSAVDAALNFFEQNGITLSKRPDVRFFDVPHPNDPKFLAEAIADPEEMINMWEDSRIRFEKMFYFYLQLKVSKAALKQRGHVEEAETRRYAQEGADQQIRKGGGDVNFYNGIRKSIYDLRSTMVHEFWHIKEGEAGLYKLPIHEGTATYAQYRYRGEPIDLYAGNSNDYMIRYAQCAQITERVVASEENPLQAILKPKVRKQIMKEFEVCLDRMNYYEAKVVFGRWGKDAEREKLMSRPTYRDFCENQTAENYLKALEDSGRHILAAELRRQDLRYLTGMYGIIFPKK